MRAGDSLKKDKVAAWRGDAQVSGKITDEAGKGIPEAKVTFIFAKSNDGFFATTKKNGEFSVMIGLIVDGELTVGVVLEPVQRRLTYATRGAGCWAIDGNDSPILRKLKIGFERDTPPEDGLKIRDLLSQAEAFSVGDTENVSPASMIQAVQDSRVDVMITWEPAVGWFLRNYPDLVVTRVPNSRTTGGPEQYLFPMSMAVRKNDEALKKRLDGVIADRKSALEEILRHYNVQLYPSAADTL